MKYKILIGSEIKKAYLPIQVQEGLDIDWLPKSTDKRKTLLELIPKYDALLTYGQKVDPELLDLATKLKIVSNHGVGYDNINVEYAREKRVIVANTPNGPTAPTANIAMGLMISVMRRIVETDRLIRKEAMPWGSVDMYGSSITGKKLGILGMGRIGKELAKRALAFDMEILYHNRNQLPAMEASKYQATYCTFEELITQSDVISIHTPLNKATHHLIDRQALSLMKTTAFIINTSRGNVIDQEALIDALKNGKIAGAGLDVFANEPAVPSEFYDLPNVVLTPHIGSATNEDRKAMFEEALENILQFFRGENVVNRVD